MKKIYKAPLTEVVKINAEQMICESVEGFTQSKGVTEKSGASALSKDDYDYDEDLW